jgi:hypothetical protein
MSTNDCDLTIFEVWNPRLPLVLGTPDIIQFPYYGGSVSSDAKCMFNNTTRLQPCLEHIRCHVLRCAIHTNASALTISWYILFGCYPLNIVQEATILYQTFNFKIPWTDGLQSTGIF